MRDAVIIQALGQWGGVLSARETLFLPLVSLNNKYLLENALLKIKTIQFTSDIRLTTHLVHF